MTTTSPRRILVTGSRHWHDHVAIADALLSAWRYLGGEQQPERPTTVIHGGARGADACADAAARRYGWRIEIHPADWNTHGRAAGPVRNTAMVQAGADLCLAFPIGDSPGTRGCLDLARRAGIPTLVFEGQPQHTEPIR